MKKILKHGLMLMIGLHPVTSVAEDVTRDLQVNGFASASAAWLDNDQGGEYTQDAYGNPGYTEKPDFGKESVAGLQITYRIDDRSNVVTQLLSEGRNEYQTRAEWAYISRELNDNLRLRAGRFALPFFLYSETLYVGQSYPWARLPVETYANVPITNFNGVDLIASYPVGDFSLSIQALVGSTNATLKMNGMSVDGRLRNIAGLNLTLTGGDLLLRAGYTRGDIDITLPPVIPGDPLNLDQSPTSFASLGASYDDGRWFLAAEAAQLEMEGWWPDALSGYASVGHYFGNWLPYLLWSKTNTYKMDECLALQPFCTGIPGVLPGVATQYREQTTQAVGVKYALSPAVSIKSQVDRVDGFNGSSGYLSGASTVPVSAFNVFTLGLTATF